MAPLVLLQQHLQQQAVLFFFLEPLVLRLSEMRTILWFLTEGEVEVLVDPSTWTNLNKIEPGTNDRDYLSSILCCKATYGS